MPLPTNRPQLHDLTNDPRLGICLDPNGHPLPYVLTLNGAQVGTLLALLNDAKKARKSLSPWLGDLITAVAALDKQVSNDLCESDMARPCRNASPFKEGSL